MALTAANAMAHFCTALSWSIYAHIRVISASHVSACSGGARNTSRWTIILAYLLHVAAASYRVRVQYAHDSSRRIV